MRSLRNPVCPPVRLPMVIALLLGVFVLVPVAEAQGLLDEFPRTADGRPDLSGVWQAMNTAHWDVEPHMADYPVVIDLGAQFAIPPGQGVVRGGEIPYLPEARDQKEANFQNRLGTDPEAKCYMGGVPRSTYMPYPFQIFQGDENIMVVYQFASALRTIFVGGTDPSPIDTWMGWSNGRWEGDTLVVEVTGLNGQTWLDRAGNFLTSNARVVERYTPLGPNHLNYEATIEDPTLFSEPWTIEMPLYRRAEEDFRLLEFKCVPFSEEILYGHLRKEPVED